MSVTQRRSCLFGLLCAILSPIAAGESVVGGTRLGSTPAMIWVNSRLIPSLSKCLVSVGSSGARVRVSAFDDASLCAFPVGDAGLGVHLCSAIHSEQCPQVGLKMPVFTVELEARSEDGPADVAELFAPCRGYYDCRSSEFCTAQILDGVDGGVCVDMIRMIRATRVLAPAVDAVGDAGTPARRGRPR